jgi:hypothetical protein
MQTRIKIKNMSKVIINNSKLMLYQLNNLVLGIIFLVSGSFYSEKASAFTLSVESMVDQPNNGDTFIEFPTVSGTGRGGFTLTKEIGDTGTVQVTLALLLTHAGTFIRQDRNINIDLDALAVGGSISSGLFSITNTAGPLSRGNYFTVLTTSAFSPSSPQVVSLPDRHDWKVVGTPEPTSILGLFSLGILGAGATIKRQVKRNHSIEKETTKIG